MAYDIRLVKLINGETVLGKWDEAAGKLTDVALLQTIPSQQGVQMLLLPFGYPFETEVGGEIELSHVLYQFKKFPDELKTRYLEATSNLTLSTSGDLKTLSNLAGKGGNISNLLKK
ncbi:MULTISPECIES: hypothetical protein [Solidesulfovibrio]|mgnify:CR=1 FL=1|jgi:hypothetical protein|uniref:hypothetical protein n=1 Tax=Solidesulfovibrio TaxID=2910984 RepID=UPI0004966B7F|nr:MULTISPECIES: hypothetical protein [Solidesulfovibrio]MEA5089130.1 hypothetical protein [Solidesulfovibrio sp.]HML59933.1 hypothetical protein [Solidesulfovibrio sp.]